LVSTTRVWFEPLTLTTLAGSTRLASSLPALAHAESAIAAIATMTTAGERR